MEFIPVPNTAEFSMIFLQDNQRLQNVFHMKNISPWGTADLQAGANTLVDWWADEMAPITPIGTSLVLIVARSLESESAPAIEWAVGLPNEGDQSTYHFAPNNVTIAAKWSTGLRGRSYRGRTYHVGLAQEVIEDNTVAPAHLALMLAAYQALIGAVTGAGFELCVVSRFHNLLPRTTGVATPIISVAIDPTLDSQRRRLPGRGQ